MLDAFGSAVDEKFGEKCLDIFVFEDVQNTAGGDKEGIAEMGGRVIFLDESVVTSGKDGKILAHEIGHNLSLDHHLESDNVMHELITGEILDDQQCSDVMNHLEKNKNKLAGTKEKRELRNGQKIEDKKKIKPLKKR